MRRAYFKLKVFLNYIRIDKFTIFGKQNSKRMSKLLGNPWGVRSNTEHRHRSKHNNGGEKKSLIENNSKIR